MRPCDGTHPCLPESIVPLTIFMRGPLLSEAVVVDLEALQSLHVMCGPSCTSVPYWNKLQAGCRPGTLLSIPSLAAQDTLPCIVASRCCVRLVPARSVFHCPCAHVDQGCSQLGLPQAGGSRFAKGLSLAKRPTFLGTETATAAQTVRLPGMRGWVTTSCRKSQLPPSWEIITCSHVRDN